MRRVLDVTTGISTAASAVTLYFWLASASGWKLEKWDLSLPEIQTHVPDRAVTGLTSVGGNNGLGDVSLRIVRYQPVMHPVDGPPEEYRDQLYPFTTWVLSLSKSSRAYGFSSSREPVFDPTRPRLDGRFDKNTAHPRLLGVYEEWGIPFWFIFLLLAILPATRGIYGSVNKHGWPPAVSVALGLTAAGFALFLIGSYDRGWSGNLELVLSLVLAGCGFVMALVTALRKRAWLPIAFNAAYWGTIFLVHGTRH